MNEQFENEKLLQYESGATFVRRCSICNRYVKADKTIKTNETGLKDEANATCKKCGRVKMIY